MTRRLGFLIMIVVLVGLGAPNRAAADEGARCILYGDSGLCKLWAVVGGSEGPGDGEPGGGRSGNGSGSGLGPCGPRPCVSGYGVWNAARGCYVQPEDPQPPFTELIWEGRTEGVIMRCVISAAISSATTHFWVSSEDPAALPDPRVLAQSALEQMDLRPIRIGSFPHTVDRSPMSLGVVGRNVWMWVDGASASTVGPIVKSASAGGYTVTATALVTQVVWDMGNGDTVACGQGTPYPATTEADPVSPDCGYVYTHDGHYTITATSYWELNWSGIGQSGVIPLELTTSEQLSVAEIQVVNVPVSQD